jgi:hypothetical protein
MMNYVLGVASVFFIVIVSGFFSGQLLPSQLGIALLSSVSTAAFSAIFAWNSKP